MKTALYRHYGSDRTRPLYIGVTCEPVCRERTHRFQSPWYPEIEEITLEWFPTRREAYRAETLAIETENPVHNRIQPKVQWWHRYPEGSHPLVEYMRERLMQQCDFAKLLGVAQCCVSSWVCGRTTPSRENRARIETVTNGAVPASSWEGR